MTRYGYAGYHMVEGSAWPFVASLGALGMVTGLVKWFHLFLYDLVTLSFICVLICAWMWWRDIIREGTLTGKHPVIVMRGLKMGMILFIFSEVLFFFSFFWAFFHASLAPSVEIGSVWPPVGIECLNSWGVPLLNTAVLLGSGVSVTWCHHSVKNKVKNEALVAMLLTVSLGAYFTMLQYGEYVEASYSIADSGYGSSFFLATGFHGAHVMIGSLFLTVCFFRVYFDHFSEERHFGMEAAIWYWHFVDVIWVFLFLWVYCWGSW
uniref:Cytochrome c oxidase subunit 3 n=1 Tax=Tropidomya abbreviata TaxID=102404 RepID=A0A1U9XPK3_9BIVA|nr:cytochrome c oxidase subunit III [Tropidomya abbreviata]AQZ26177.1 cytochrome c oxidase subunit III [Tropidomya abbreviata]